MRDYFAILTEAYVPTVTGAGSNAVINLSPDYSVPLSWVSNDVAFVAEAGTAGKAVVTFAGTYAVGDFVRVTLTTQERSSQVLTKSYTHTVQAGAISVTAVAAAFAALITADINSGLSEYYATAANVAGVLTVTQAQPEKRAIQCVAYTDSAAGTTAVVITATVVSEGQPSDLVARGIPAGDINLASYDTVKLIVAADSASPFIDSRGKTVREIYWYGSNPQGAVLAGLIP